MWLFKVYHALRHIFCKYWAYLCNICTVTFSSTVYCNYLIFIVFISDLPQPYNKCSAVAQMGDHFGHSRHGPKIGVGCAPLGELDPHVTQ